MINAEGGRHIIKCTKIFGEEDVTIMVLSIPDNQKNNGFPHSILNRVSMLKNLDHPNIVGSIFFLLFFLHLFSVIVSFFVDIN